MLKLLLISTLILSLNASEKKTTPTIRDSKSDTEAVRTGFYFYEDPQDANKKKAVKATPAQQMQADLTKELIKEMRENNKLQKKILKKLEYAFPRTIPEYTINKKTGEQCKSNSSADCFVMPVIKEAQNSVPVMAEMLRDPSSENVKKYLEWQGAYFNQSFKVGNGFSLVGKQYGRELTKVDGMGYTQMPLEGSKQNDMAYLQKTATIKKLGNKLGLMVFLGKSREFERNKYGKNYMTVIYSSLKDMKNFKLVFETKEDKEYIEKKIKRYKTDWEKYQKINTIVSPGYFKKFNIKLTPSSVALYKKEDGEMIWQKLGYTMTARPIINTIYNFLSFHDIVKPGALNENDTWKMADELRLGKEISKEFIDSIDINESKIKVSDDQIIIKKQKGSKK